MLAGETHRGVVLDELRRIVGAANVREDAPLDRLTTWRVGGKALATCTVADVSALERAVRVVAAAGMPWLVLGRGSNVLIGDAGFPGVVIVNRADELALHGPAVTAASGALLSVLARRTVAAGLVGLEWCHDIPGSVGGAVMSNAGANGGAIADVLESVRMLMPDGSSGDCPAEALAFGYRRSALRAEMPLPCWERPVVLTARFHLTVGDVVDIKRRMTQQRARRKATQPGGASAGSVFKNPPGDSAGRLIEQAGLKGLRCGDASISTLHANFIVTGPRATAGDVLQLITLARTAVERAAGIRLEPEVQLVTAEGRIGPPADDLLCGPPSGDAV